MSAARAGARAVVLWEPLEDVACAAREVGRSAQPVYIHDYTCVYNCSYIYPRTPSYLYLLRTCLRWVWRVQIPDEALAALGVSRSEWLRFQARYGWHPEAILEAVFLSINLILACLEQFFDDLCVLYACAVLYFCMCEAGPWGRVVIAITFIESIVHANHFMFPWVSLYHGDFVLHLCSVCFNKDVCSCSSVSQRCHRFQNIGIRIRTNSPNLSSNDHD